MDASESMRLFSKRYVSGMRQVKHILHNRVPLWAIRRWHLRPMGIDPEALRHSHDNQGFDEKISTSPHQRMYRGT